MLRILEIKVLNNNFIKGYLIDEEICDNLVNLFLTSSNTKPGMVGNGQVNNKIKESTDLILNPNEIPQDYMDALKTCSDHYIKDFPESKMNGFGIFEHAQIQYYPPGGGFKVWHSERGIKIPELTRHLVWMTYLNDVEDGGTEFLYQNLKTEAKKGITIIWPSDWMYTHRSIISHQEKYIITGWFNLKGIK